VRPPACALVTAMVPCEIYGQGTPLRTHAGSWTNNMRPDYLHCFSSFNGLLWRTSHSLTPLTWSTSQGMTTSFVSRVGSWCFTYPDDHHGIDTNQSFPLKCEKYTVWYTSIFGRISGFGTQVTSPASWFFPCQYSYKMFL
jgi:hypothetical protein